GSLHRPAQFAIVKLVPDDAVYGRYRSGHYRSMTYGRDGVRIRIVRIGEVRAACDEPFESFIPEEMIEALQIVGSKLIDEYEDDEFGLRSDGAFRFGMLGCGESLNEERKSDYRRERPAQI